MNIQEGSIIRKVLDSNTVTHYNCNIHTNNRGLLRNVWVVECDNELSIQSTLTNKLFNIELDNYLKNHNLSVVE